MTVTPAGTRTIEGHILRGPRFHAVRGRVVVEEGRIDAVEETGTESTDIVVPAFVNAHTHVGDSIAKEAGEGLDLEALVAPPDGLKHRLLREADRGETVEAIRRSARFMETAGTAAFLDFREGGIEGVEMLREATRGLSIRAVILGREGLDAMASGDGFGASGARDGDFESAAAATRDAGKLFGIHAGELDPHDIDGAFALDPDFLVHMVHPEPAHLDRLEDRETPVVVCPRSNLVTGVGTPPITDLLERTSVALGTDNVMLNSPSMFREMAVAAKVCDVPARDVLGMATRAGAELVGMDAGVIEPGRAAKLLVLDGDSDNLSGARNPVRAVVRRAGPADVKRVFL